MPRKVQPSVQKILKALQNAQNMGIPRMPAIPVRRGRPRKNKAKAVGLNDVKIIPVANGYIVTSTTTGSEMFVFEELDKVFEFVRVKMKPTGEQTDFLESV